MSRYARKRDGRGGQRRPVSLPRRPLVLAGIGLAGIAGAGATIGGLASAAVPEFPNNIVVFPDRDFVTVEGYQDHIGETGLIKVIRAGQVVGSAEGVVGQGDVAFEINHPGGYCWGAGTNLQVTPDIKAGDKVVISFDGQEAGDTIVGDAAVDLAPTLSGTTLTVKGHIGPGVNPAQLEQRIVNPDLTDTDVARRDIRAVPGPLTPAAKGGYSSSLTVSGSTVTATYVFDTAATAQIAADGGGERMMSWQLEDADANRQGLTIAELGELGGPGMGGCPAGPGDAGAPKPGGASVVRSTDKTSVGVTWAPAEQVPGAAAVTGYDVEVIKQSPNATGERETLGKRTDANATHVNVDGLTATAGYDVEVRSMTGGKMSEAFTVQVPTASDPGDTVVPGLNASPANAAEVNVASAVTLSSEAGADIYFTTDGKPAISGDLPSSTAKLYTGPIPLAAQVTINAVAFDAAGNFSQFSGVYKPPTDTTPAPSAVTAITGSAGPASATLSWAAPEAGVTGYGIQAYTRNADDTYTKFGALKETTAKTITFNSLTPGTEYFFTVKAKNTSGYGPESDKYGPVVPVKVTDTVSIGTATWKAGDFRVKGTGTLVGAIVTIRPATTAGTIDRTRSLGTAQITPAAPPATGGEYDIRLRNAAAPATNPGKVFIESDSGGVAGPAVVANR